MLIYFCRIFNFRQIINFIERKEKMKLKSIIRTVIIAASFLFVGTTGGMQAQGFYQEDSKDPTINDTYSSETGIFRADDEFGEEGVDKGDPGDNSPIGEGILILSLLGGGYALVKRNIRRKV